jgi:hypothetical protein
LLGSLKQLLAMPEAGEQPCFDPMGPTLGNLGLDSIASEHLQADALLCLLTDGLMEVKIDEQEAWLVVRYDRPSPVFHDPATLRLTYR